MVGAPARAAPQTHRQTVYTDVDLTPFGFAPGQLWGEPTFFPCDASLAAQFEQLLAASTVRCASGTIGTGDAFVRKEMVPSIRQTFNNAVLCVEMESGAIAHTCSKLAVPCLAVRVLSDVPHSSDENQDEFSQHVDGVMDSLGALLAHFLAQLTF